MKVSELIKHLRKALDDYGDLECRSWPDNVDENEMIHHVMYCDDLILICGKDIAEAL